MVWKSFAKPSCHVMSSSLSRCPLSTKSWGSMYEGVNSCGILDIYLHGINNFWKALLSPKCQLPCQWSLELGSMRTGGHSDRSWDIQDSQLHGNFCLTLISLKCHLPCQDASCPQSQELKSIRIGGLPERSNDVQGTIPGDLTQF